MLHYGIKMVYSDATVTKDTTVKSASFNGYGQIVSMLTDFSPNDKKYVKDISLLLEEGVINKLIADLRGMTKYKENSKQHKIDLLNTLLKDCPEFSVNDELERKRTVTHQFKSASEAEKIGDQRTKTYTSWLQMKAAVQKENPKGSDEYLYMKLFDQLPSRDDLGSVFVFDYHGSLKE
jgi:rubrerythrin